MRRVVVIGCGGSGKSTISKRLSTLLDLPITHLDAVFYDKRWNPMQSDEFAAAQQRLVQRDRWLIEGNYASTLPIRLAAADTVIFLDLPAVVCLWGIAQRRWRYRGGQHHQDGVFDRITWSFVKYTLSYRKTMRPKGPRTHRHARSKRNPDRAAQPESRQRYRGQDGGDRLGQQLTNRQELTFKPGRQALTFGGGASPSTAL